MYANLVDTTTAILLALHHATSPSLVLGKEIECQRMLTERDGVEELVDLTIGKRNHRKQRTEELLLHDRFIDTDWIDDGGLIFAQLTAAIATKYYPVTVFIGQIGTLAPSGLGYKTGIVIIGQGRLPYLTDKGFSSLRPDVPRMSFVNGLVR